MLQRTDDNGAETRGSDTFFQDAAFRQQKAAQPCQSQLALDCPSTLLKVPAVLSSTDHPVHQNEQLNVFCFAEIAENKRS